MPESDNTLHPIKQFCPDCFMDGHMERVHHKDTTDTYQCRWCDRDWWPDELEDTWLNLWRLTHGEHAPELRVLNANQKGRR